MRSGRRVVRVLVVAAVLAMPACEDMRENLHPVCEVRPPTILMAESVRSASRIPCVKSLPIGWTWGGFRAEDGETTFILNATAGGENAVTVRLVPRCSVEPTGGADPDEIEVDQHIISEDPYEAERTYPFDGGCAIVRVAFVPGAPVDRLLRDVDRSVGFLDRAAIDAELRSESDRRLDPADV